MPLRYQRWLLRAIYILIGAMLISKSTSDTTSAIGFFVLFIVLSFCYPRLVVWLEVFLFRFARCRACGAHFDLVDLWKCACGYVISKHRHLFRGCPRCKSHFPYIKCPRCGASVDL